MDLVVEKIFEACAIYDEKCAPFYYSCCDDAVCAADGLQIKKNFSLKAVTEINRVNLMNNIAQKYCVNVAYRAVGNLILVEHSSRNDAVVETDRVQNCMDVIKNNLERAATFVPTPPYYYSKNNVENKGKKWCNIVLENLDLFSETERIEIIEFFKSRLNGCSVEWENNVLYVS